VFARAVRAYAMATGQDEEDVRAQVLKTQTANEELHSERAMLARRLEQTEERLQRAADEGRAT
jgi:hypothetical protein